MIFHLIRVGIWICDKLYELWSQDQWWLIIFHFICLGIWICDKLDEQWSQDAAAVCEQPAGAGPPAATLAGVPGAARRGGTSSQKQ